MKPASQMMKQVLRGGSAVIASLIIGGASFTFAQESVAVRAALVTGGLPLDDPNAAAWSSASPASFPMSPQVHWPNRIQEVTVKDVAVRALHDGKQVAFLWNMPIPAGSGRWRGARIHGWGQEGAFCPRATDAAGRRWAGQYLVLEK